MTTSKKMRQRRIRRQRRMALVFIVMVITVIFAHAAFSDNTSVEKVDIISYVVTSGDTIWDIALKYRPEGKNLSAFIHEIEVNNGVKHGNIICGQTLFIPISK